MDWSFEDYRYLFLFLLIPLLSFLILHFLKWRNKKRLLFADKGFQDFFFLQNNRYTYVFTILYIAAFVFLFLAFANLISGKEEIEVKQRLSNVVFVMDVSNSMNAEDVAPSRLEREKQIVLKSLKNMSNERVGVVVFAGSAVSIMPLTTDYSAIESYIAGIETSIIGQQGTDFLEAMKQAVRMYYNSSKEGRSVVLISDGEDNEGNVSPAIGLAKSNHVKIISVGIGTEQGAPVPDYTFGQLMGYKQDSFGETVISKRETQALVQMSNDTSGSYIDGNSEKASQEILQALSKIKTSTEVKTNSQSSVYYYQWFLGISLLLFFIIYLTNPKRDFNI